MEASMLLLFQELIIVNERNDEIMTVEEVAEYLKIKRRTVCDLAQKGLVPGVKIGRQWRFKKEAINKIFEQGILTNRGAMKKEEEGR